MCRAHSSVRSYAAPGRLAIETGRGILDLVVSRSSPTLSQVRVDMGQPLLNPEDIPVNSSLCMALLLIFAQQLLVITRWWDSAKLDVA